MRITLLAAATLFLLPMAAMADDDDAPTDEQMAKIDAVLAEKQCEVDPANVEVEDGVFDLDDVMCAGGQYDIKLDANYAVTEERKE